MTRFPSAAVLVLALALAPGVAGAQSETLLDDVQRATIGDYFKQQAVKAAAAEKARKERQAKPADEAKGAAKPPAKAAAKPKKVEKPKKPEKPKAAAKDKKKDKDKGKGKAKANGKNGKNGKNANKAKPPAQAARASLERGQILAPDLPRRALPKDLDTQLGKPARGTQRVIVGDDIVLFERKSGRILDIFEDVVKTDSRGR